MNTRSFLLSALIAGVVMALLGNIPVVNFLNCILCMWVWVSGILAVYLYRRFEKASPNLTTGQSAGLGAASGAAGALIGALVSMVFNSLGMAQAVQALNADPNLAPYTDFFLSPRFAWLVLLINLVLYALFGAAGAVLATRLIWKKPANNDTGPA